MTQLNNSNFAKNKILDKHVVTINFDTYPEPGGSSANSPSAETEKFSPFLGKTNMSRPLTYPYTSPLLGLSDMDETSVPYEAEVPVQESVIVSSNHVHDEDERQVRQNNSEVGYASVIADTKKRKPPEPGEAYVTKVYKMQSEPEAMDLSMPSSAEKCSRIAEYEDYGTASYKFNGFVTTTQRHEETCSPQPPSVILNEVQIRPPSPEEDMDEGSKHSMIRYLNFRAV